MDAAIAPQSRSNGTEVQQVFEAFYTAYMQAVKWIARMMHNGDLVLEVTEAIRLERWKKQHFSFREKLLDLHEKPRYKGKLKVFKQIWGDDQPFADLLKAAESEGSTPSAPDNEEPPPPEPEEEDPET